MNKVKGCAACYPSKRTFASLPPELKRRVVEKLSRLAAAVVGTSITSGDEVANERRHKASLRLEDYIAGEPHVEA